MVNFGALFRLALTVGLASAVGLSAGQQSSIFIGPRTFAKKSNRTQKIEPRPYTVLVAYKSGIKSSAISLIENRFGIYEDHKISSPFFKRYFISQAAQIKGITSQAVISGLRQMPSVRVAEYDMPVSPDQVNDPQYSAQWSLHNTGQTGGTPGADIHAPEAWPLIPVVSPVLVAVLDDGVEINHSDLAANIAVNAGEIPGDGIDNDGNGFIDDVKGWDFADGDNDPSPPSATSSHGTHVAGIVAAVSNNAVGIASASRNVKILPVRFYRGQSTWISDLILACDYARIRGAKVVNISYNLDGWTQLLVDAFNRLNSIDSVVMLSAGNSGAANPARLGMLNQAPNLCFVASTDANDNLSAFSNYGPQVQVAAPGENIISTIPFGNYANMSGTSMATPLAAGIMGSIRAIFPSMTATQSINRLGITCDKKSSLNGKVKFGRVNLANAIQTDTIPPSPVSNLMVLRRSSGTFLVRFNASGNDGLSGGASAYELRTSKFPITDANFGSATLNNFQTNTPVSGYPVEDSVSGIVPGGSYYIGVKAFDAVGNESPVVSTGPFSLLPPVAYDDMEGTTTFTGTGSWAVTTEAANSGTHSWSDSPGGSYANNTNSTLTYNTPIAVSGPMTASYFMRYDLEQGYDLLNFEVSTDGGTTWSVLNSTTGLSGPAFQSFSVPLTSYQGQTIRLRFHMTSDSSVTGDGVYIDDFALQSLATTFSDDVEGTANFSGTGSTWVISTESSSSPTRAWNDSPGANYANNTNQVLKGITDIDADAVGSPAIVFKGLINTEPGFDFLNVLTSMDGGVNWMPRASFSGLGTTFTSYFAPMNVLGTARIGFQLTSDSTNVADGASLDDISVVGEPWVQQISGTVGLNGYNSTKNFTVKIRSGSTVLQTNTVPMTGLTGSFSFNTGFYGVNDIVIQGPSYLRRVMPAVELTAFTSVSTNLINGDINGDNVIGTGDFNALRAAWGSIPANSNWNANADLDGNGVIGTGDFNILRANWGAVGDN
jgi:subtilisin family serine protease